MSKSVFAGGPMRAARRFTAGKTGRILSRLVLGRKREAALAVFLTLGIFLAGCTAPVSDTIPSIPKDHPANKFFQAAQTGMLSDRVCRDNQGDPEIPIGKIEAGEGYTKTGDLMAGVFRFRDNTTGKKYLGVSFLQYSGFLQIPKVCSWEEK